MQKFLDIILILDSLTSDRKITECSELVGFDSLLHVGNRDSTFTHALTAKETKLKNLPKAKCSSQAGKLVFGQEPCKQGKCVTEMDLEETHTGISEGHKSSRADTEQSSATESWEERKFQKCEDKGCRKEKERAHILKGHFTLWKPVCFGLLLKN